jgi:predicted transcriptional regulator of viral defense system
VAVDVHVVLLRSGGSATLAELRAASVSRAQLLRQVRKGSVTTVARGVYAISDLVASLSGDPARLHALVVSAVARRSGSGLAASHHSAALMHGLDMFGPGLTDSVVTLTRCPRNASGRSTRAQARVLVAELPPEHVASFHGVPVTTVARTVADLARTLPFTEGVVVADSALHAKRTTKVELEAVLARCGRWPGLKRAAGVVAFSHECSESVLESIARVVFHDHGLPPPALQVNISGRKYIGRVDFLWLAYRTVVEVDGALKYADPSRAIDQLRRDELLREAGFEVVHFTWSQIVYEPDQVIARIRTAFRRASAR